MLIILTFCLVIASIMVLCVKKNWESIFLFGLSSSLMLEIVGIMIFIAKKGGISQEVASFLFFTKEIQSKLQFTLITFNQMGYLIALGRTLFPFFLMLMALHYSMIPFIKKNIWITRAIFIIPVLSIFFYFPSIYHAITERALWVQKLLTNGSKIWITLYLFIGLGLLVIEYFSITMKFCRRQFSLIIICMISMSGLFSLYYRQDPGQVYYFYSYTYAWNEGIGYLQVNPSLLSYLVLVVVSIICCVLGFYSLLRYTQRSFQKNWDDIAMERKFDTAKVGASMFVHSMKNQLLSNRVIFKRIKQLYEQPQVDTVKLKEYVDTLEDLDNTLLLRMEELYSFVKSNSICMVPVSLGEISQNALERFHKKYPEVDVDLEIDEETMVLADKIHLCEALYNLLINAQDAVLEAGRGENGRVSLISHMERLYTVIEVRDNGNGITKKQMEKIYDPFYSSKNSNFNWGMGLYYVREIVKSHLGSLRLESKVGVGTSFYILLPKYQ